MHIEKFKANSVGVVIAHIIRAKTKEDLPRNYKNENIDISKSYLNYRLDGCNSAFAKYKEILTREDVKVQKRKDLNTYCSVCLTLPTDVKPKDEKRFFEIAYEFLQKRYAPYNNVVIAEVHKDETKTDKPGRPHLHFLFVPLVLDKRHKEKTNKERFKVCAKEIINKQDLKTLHIDCAKYVEEKLGYSVSILCEEKQNNEKESNTTEKLRNILNSKLSKKLSSEEYKKAKDLINETIETFEKQNDKYYEMIYKYNTINTKTRELEKEHNRKMKEYKKQEENERRRIREEVFEDTSNRKNENCKMFEADDLFV